MACASQSMIPANSCAFPSQRILNKSQKAWRNSKLFSASPSSKSDETDCNVEECAPDKEVGKVSMEWLAGEKTRVVGTFPPKKKGWTGYVEKDTAGQTNIYSVEPAVYVSESVIGSGTAGKSADGAENTAAIAAGLAFISIAAASSILLQVGKNPPAVQTLEYSGPPLSYYISKFQPVKTVEAAIPTETQTQSSQIVESESTSPEVPEVQVELNSQVESQSSS